MALGTILGAVGAFGSTILNFINQRKAQDAQKAEANRAESHYEAIANEDPNSNRANVAVNKQYDRDVQKQLANARAIGAINGATPEYDIAVQGKAIEGKSNLMSNQSANAQVRADKAMESAEAVRQQAAAQEQANRAAMSESIANGISNVATGAASIIDSKMAKAPAEPTNTTQNVAKVATGTATKSGATSAQPNQKGTNYPDYAYALNDWYSRTYGKKNNA